MSRTSIGRAIYDKVNKELIPTGGLIENDIDNALSSNSQNALENRIINAEFNRTYRTTDTAETTLADGDYIPFYDTSASAQRKSTWGNVKDKLPKPSWTIDGELATFNFN